MFCTMPKPYLDFIIHIQPNGYPLKNQQNVSYINNIVLLALQFWYNLLWTKVFLLCRSSRKRVLGPLTCRQSQLEWPKPQDERASGLNRKRRRKLQWAASAAPDFSLFCCASLLLPAHTHLIWKDAGKGCPGSWWKDEGGGGQGEASKQPLKSRWVATTFFL